MIGVFSLDPSGPVLMGSQVRLRPARERDWEEWSQLREVSRDFLVPWEPAWPSDALSRAAYRRRLRLYNQEWRSDIGYSFLVFRRGDGRLVGGISLANLRRGVAQMASVGYWIGQPHARQGYASDALRTVLEFAFDQLGLHRVEAACLPTNLASQGVLRKVGFTEEGYARRYLRINGQWCDHLLFAMLRDDPWRLPQR